MDDSPGVWKEGSAGEDPGETSHGASGCSQVGSFCPPRDQDGARLKASVVGAQSSSVGRTVRGVVFQSADVSSTLRGCTGYRWLCPGRLALASASIGESPPSGPYGSAPR